VRHHLFLIVGLLLGLPAVASAAPEAQVIEDALIKAVADVKPAVAGIIVSRSEAYRRYEPAANPDTPGKLGRFDADALITALPPERAAERSAILRLDLQRDDHIPESFGSGIVIDASGLVLTNAHVVRNATRIYVRLPGKKGSYADIHALDTRIDLAVLRLLDPPPGLRAVRLGDGDKVVQGQFVALLAYAPAAGLRNDGPTLAWGPVAALRQPAVAAVGDSEKPRGPLHQYGTLLQTDARVQAGCSGGALINLSGEVVGLTTTTAVVRGDDNVGSFAVPFGVGVRRLIDILRRGEEIEYGFLGISFRPGPVRDGVQVDNVIGNGPAQRAGLESGDLIKRIGGETIETQDDLFLQAGLNPAGSIVKVQVLRGGVSRTLELQLGKFHNESPFIASNRPAARFGLRVDPAVIYCQRERGEAVPAVGVVVREVQPVSPADKAHLQSGKLVTQVNGKDVTSPADFYRAVDAAGDRVRLTVLRDDNSHETVELTKPARP
jgi:serine protease Do